MVDAAHEATGQGLTVAVTGVTGTLGRALVPLLEADDGVARVVGIARRHVDPSTEGWAKTTFRSADVRDAHALTEAFEGAHVVVHLAFLVTGTASTAVTRAVNVGGSLHAFRAAATVGAQRFVYSSSAAAYGFHADNPVRMTEDWPTRPDPRFFYAQEKAELEASLLHEAEARPDVGLYVLRPPIVLGPHAVGAKNPFPEWLQPALGAMTTALASVPRQLWFRPPAVLPALPLQFVHEADVARALRCCIVGDGPPGAYNIAGDGVLTLHDVVREMGLRPLGVPVGLSQRIAGTIASLPTPRVLPPVTGWVDALSHPAIVDTDKAKQQLGWVPRWTGLEALRATLRPDGTAKR